MIGVKWIFKINVNTKEKLEKHKAQLVAKGYNQQFGIDYEKIFALVTQMETIRLLLSLATQMK